MLHLLRSGIGRLCCKSLKTPGDKFPARSRNKPRSLIDVASGSLPKSPVSLSPGAMRMFTRKPRLQLEKFDCDQRCKKTFATQSAKSRSTRAMDLEYKCGIEILLAAHAARPPTIIRIGRSR